MMQLGDLVFVGLLSLCECFSVRAGLAMRELGESNLSIAIHRGPAMVATLNDHLDYFGATVSTAEQLLATAPQRGSATQLVVSNAIAMDEAVAETIAARQLVFRVEQQLSTTPQVWPHRVFASEPSNEGRKEEEIVR